MRFAALPFEWDVEDVIPDDGADWDASLYMAPQVFGWTCSACSLDWVLTATGSRLSARGKTIAEIGYPHNINPQYGLMDSSGTQLRRVLEDYGLQSEHDWLGFDAVYELALGTTGMMSGAAWYHWVAIRGVSGDNLWIANSAPGYKGVYDILTRADFNRLGGFSVVWLVED